MILDQVARGSNPPLAQLFLSVSIFFWSLSFFWLLKVKTAKNF